MRFFINGHWLTIHQISGLASNPIAAAVLKADKSHYPELFDTVVSSSIDSIQAHQPHKKSVFSPENFGFNPVASQNFYPLYKSAQLVAQPQQYQTDTYYSSRPQTAAKSAAISQKPLQYDIQTIHDPNYKIYKTEEPAQGEEILAALKQNPSVAAYFNPPTTNVEISHPLDYRKEELLENPELIDQNYKKNAYLPGPSRIRRYTHGRQRQNTKKRHDDDEDPYEYKSDYTSRPKAFDTDTYSSAYKEEKDPNKDYEYPYAYDNGYDHKEYERIKELSEKQAAEIKQNPGNCQEVKKDGMSCMVCKDPKTGGNYESCSYVAEPKNNKYAYSKERKFDTADEPDEPEKQDDSRESKKPAKYEESKDEHDSEKPLAELRSETDKSEEADDGYKGYYVHSSQPKPSAELRSSDESHSEENSDSSKKPYNYKAALPGFYSNNEQKKDVEHVLAEFKKKDRSSCKKVQKNGMTCYQCIDKSGLKHEECMFVSESAPKQSHLAYQELKEFTSKPATLDGTVGAESQIVTTAAPLKSAALVVSPNGYGRKLKRKKVNIAGAATNTVAKTVSPTQVAAPVVQPLRSRKTKRSENSDGDLPETNSEVKLAPPEEFAGTDSKGAYWAETMPRYSRTLGVTLPEFMLSRSEHEASFDETIAGV